MTDEADRRTDTARRHRPHLCIASRGKNEQAYFRAANVSSVVSSPIFFLKIYTKICAFSCTVYVSGFLKLENGVPGPVAVAPVGRVSRVDP